MEPKTEINKKITKVLKDIRNTKATQKGEIYVFGKSRPVIREYTDRYITLCDSSTCDAGENCCHYFEKSKIGLCINHDSYYNVQTLDGSIILSQVTQYDEEEIIKKCDRLYEVFIKK